MRPATSDIGVSSGSVPAAVADGLIGDAGDFLLQHLSVSIGSGARCRIGEEHQAVAEEAIFLLDRLLHLDDHVGIAPDVVGGADDLRAGGLVFVVGEGGEFARVGFDQHLVPGLGQRLHARRGDADAALMVFDFLRHSDDHAFS